MGADFVVGDHNIVLLAISSDQNYTNSKYDYGIISGSSYAGYHDATPNKVGLVELNSSHLDNILSGGSITILKTVTFTGNLQDLSLTVGFHFGGFEFHSGRTLLGGVTLGASYSDEYGQSGGDATASIGGFLLWPIKQFLPK
jgi:hypothetical protein